MSELPSGSGADEAPVLRLAAIVLFALITALSAVALFVTLAIGEPLGANTLGLIVYYTFPVMGVLIAWRRPANRIAWLNLVIGLVWALEGILWSLVLYEMARPGTFGGTGVFSAVADPLWIPGLFLSVILLPLLYPDGRPPLRWRWLARFSVALIALAYTGSLFQPATSSWGRPVLANPLHPEWWPSSLDGVALAFVAVLLGCVGATGFSLVWRYRRSTGIERLQLRSLMAAGVAAVVVFLLAVTVVEAVAGASAAVLSTLSFALIPAAIGVAVLRHRLYDLDRLISRTVTYAALVIALGSLYSGTVLLMRGVLPGDSDVAVAGSTLAVAAVFAPLRRWVKDRVDRRFDRARYDAEVEVSKFGHRLRHEVDVATLSRELVDVVNVTMHPSTSGLWIRGEHP